MEGNNNGGSTAPAAAAQPTLKRRGRPPKKAGAGTQELGLKGKGVERVSIRAIDNAIGRYVLARDERMELTKKEVETKTALIKVMRDNKDKLSVDAEGTIVYKHDDLLVTLKHGKDELKVKTEEDDDGND
jgi:hypothetical protein